MRDPTLAAVGRVMRSVMRWGRSVMRPVQPQLAKSLMLAAATACCSLSLAADAPAPAPAAADGQPGTQHWNFSVTLDGKPIGSHRFSLQTDGAQRTLVSDASFNVKFLGFTAYAYQHKATEHWRGDCLTALTSATNATARTCKCGAGRRATASRSARPSRRPPAAA